ncbi:hypothetical protein BGZ61DRAFT_111198 [Ilyonectria robusta]|uniref:uncharacterized protein n=1 Tax=Ilyonectria robusta TaxID=1079257 RepID=UPI001E8E63CD|nr:uncharacterized protein BGZ61DRAFT_111198 [Ilyonectria robusta]KAH8669845.1 hypothetical protein BGZ61DRAFT_111198 [Ilyonectria robusta]
MDRKERLCALVPAARHYALLQHGILRAEATVIVIIRSSPHRHPFMDHFNLSSPSPSPAKTCPSASRGSRSRTRPLTHPRARKQLHPPGRNPTSIAPIANFPSNASADAPTRGFGSKPSLPLAHSPLRTPAAGRWARPLCGKCSNILHA